MFFDEPAGKFEGIVEFPRKLIIGLSLSVVVLFIFMPSPLIEFCQSTVRELF
jgi:hypothetical protein